MDSTVIVKELDVSDVVTFVIGSKTACQMIFVWLFSPSPSPSLSKIHRTPFHSLT